MQSHGQPISCRPEGNMCYLKSSNMQQLYTLTRTMAAIANS